MNYARVLMVLAGLTVISVASAASADVRRETTARRPYITEIGQPYAISRATLDSESERINELQDYIYNYGYPDYAEIQEIRPEWPWESYEVRLYYLRRNLQLDFIHVLSLEEAAPNLGVKMFEGGIPASKRVEIEAALLAPKPTTTSEVTTVESTTPQDSLSALVARVEAAAERAAQAADKAVAQSEAAERAANRTTTIVEKLIETEKPARHRR